VLTALLWSGCGQVPIEATPRPAPKPAQDLVATPRAPAPPLSRVPLRTRLADEAASRPASALRAEQLFLALERRGLLLSRKRQVLASTVGARYCELAVSDAGLGVSLCEYGDDAAARAGSEASHRLFDPIVPGRTLLTHAGSLLTLTSAESERARREASTIANTFAALTPVPRTP
jgi:hypothetical protein